MNENIVVTNYETKEKHLYVPPKEIRILLQKHPALQAIATKIGANPVLQKLVGNIIGTESFSVNHKRTHHADGINTPVLPSDGYLTRSEISDEGISTVLGHLEIDIKRMLGLSQDSDSVFHKEIGNKFKNIKGGQHDLAILKPQHKHCCSVPFRSTVKNIYRVGKDGSILPDKIANNKIHEKTYSTDPEFARVNADDLNIFDGNQRMVFVLETEIDGEPMEYMMVAHAAAFVSGIESLINNGQEISPGTPLFKFHQGSSLSTLWPKEFCEKFQTLPEVEALTTKNKVLEVLEGQVIYERI